MMTLLRPTALARCRVFGVFAVEAPQGPIRIRSRRARALLGYLLLAPPGGATRERLSGLLWSDRGEEQARASLRQCLLELRKELLEAELDRDPRAEIYACGPPGMLEAVRALCAEHEAPGQLALESGMACGFGACFGCVVATRDGYVRLCVDGPVLDAATLEAVPAR